MLQWNTTEELKENTTDTNNNNEESQNCSAERKRTDNKKVYSIWVHFYEVLE